MKSYLICVFVFLINILLNAQNEDELIELREIIPDIELDIKYATDDNFVKQNLYISDVCYLSLGMAKKLKLVQDSLKNYGYGLKVFDGYRPRAIQYFLWKIFPDSNYVAHPDRGSRHNRGSAIDLTIIDYFTKKELDMGTPFDFFGEKASHNYKKFNNTILRNRELLRDFMVRIGGFEVYEFEWWHYNYKEGKNFPLKDYQTKN